MIKQSWYAPAFASLLKNRAESLVLIGVGAVQVGLHLLGLPGWVCPFRAATGIPCPGCGLTTATDQLLHGKFQLSFETHAFASVFFFAFVVMAVAAILPESYRKGMLGGIAQFETQTGITAWVLSALMLYWALRLSGVIPFVI